MKKNLLKVLLVMGLSSVVFAGQGTAARDENGYAVDGIVNVRAEVVEPITLTTENVDFGRVARGTVGNTPLREGKVHITAGNLYAANFKVTIYEGDHAISNLEDGIRLTKDGSVRGAQLKYVPKFYAEGKELTVNNGEISLQGRANRTILVKGTLDVPREADLGTYTNDMTVRVAYDTSIN